MGEVDSTVVILIVITMNAILGTVQTVKAEQSLASLKKLSAPEAKVLRCGNVVQIPSSEVTVGDVVMLDAGDYIPADGRLLECASLKVDESALTGESLGVEKTTDVIKEDEVPLGDRLNMVYSGSFVTYGRGSFVVTGIGMDTEVGKIASLLKTTSEKKTPAPGQPGSVRSETVHPDSYLLRYSLWNQRVQRRQYRRRVPVRRSACSCSYPGGSEFHRDNRAFFRYTENGERTRDHA